MSTKFVMLLAGGLPPARTLITNFVLSLFAGLDMLYIYIIYNTYTIHILLHIISFSDYVSKDASLRLKGIGKNTFSAELNAVEVWPFEVSPIIPPACLIGTQVA